MVPHRKGNIERDISSGKNDSQKSEGSDRRKRGGTSMNRHKFLLCILCRFVAIPSSYAQSIYAQNQSPARGVTIEYTVSIKKPTSHLYDVEIQIKARRAPSVSVP